MARRRATRKSETDGSRQRGTRKSEAEARVERITWALLVLVFAVFQLNPQGASQLPNWFVPAAGAVVLLGSGMYQYTRRWRVSPITWIGGAVMLFFALYNLYINPALNFLGLALITFFIVILFGLISGET